MQRKTKDEKYRKEPKSHMNMVGTYNLTWKWRPRKSREKNVIKTKSEEIVLENFLN